MNQNSSSDTVFSGNLFFFGLGDLLQLVGSHGSTGVLKLTSKYSSDTGSIYFKEGNPIDASCGSKTGLDALYSLFGWTHGEFQFKLEDVKQERIINESRMQIILSGLKMLDDGEIDKLGPITVEEDAQNNLVMGIPQPLIKGPLIDYIYVVDEESFEAGNDIVLEGKHGNWLWGVLEGTLQISKETSRGRVNIVRMGRGSYIGSITSFLLGGSVRSASVHAVDKVLLGVLDTHRLSMEFGNLSGELKSILISLDKRLKEVTDRTIDYYLDKNPIKELNLKEMSKKEDYNQEKAFTIKDGNAWIVRKTKNGDVLLASLFPGDFIGRVPFIDIDQKSLSTFIYGTPNLSMEEIDIDHTKNEFDKLSPTFKNMVENISASITATSLMACEFHKKRKMNRSNISM